jgi:hypothetical protein
MTGWTIDGRGDTGTRATHVTVKGPLHYNVSRLSGGFWLAEMDCRDGSIFQISASERSEKDAHKRCEAHAASY